MGDSHLQCFGWTSDIYGYSTQVGIIVANSEDEARQLAYDELEKRYHIKEKSESVYNNRRVYPHLDGIHDLESTLKAIDFDLFKVDLTQPFHLLGEYEE